MDVLCDGSLLRPDIHCSGAGRTYHRPHLLYIPLLSFNILSYINPYDLTLGTALIVIFLYHIFKGLFKAGIGRNIY